MEAQRQLGHRCCHSDMAWSRSQQPGPGEFQQQEPWHAPNYTGPIPPNIGALETLNLDHNEVDGNIPPELGDLRQLQKLWLNDNHLTGHIPQQLGRLSALKILHLSFNELDGPIPPELGNLAALQHLNLGWNGLSGHIPPQLRDLGALQYLDLSNNKLDGPIPPELGKLAALEKLELQRNQLSGSIPPELGKLSALKKLRLWNNKLTGPIPEELGKLAALQELFLSRNNLSGLWHTLGQDKAGSLAARPGVRFPVDLARLLDMFDHLRILKHDQNPWEHPPEAIVAGGLQAVRGYYEAMFMGGTTAVTRPLKVVIVGKETVGKTSLRRSITAGRPCMTQDGGVESTVHVDVEDHEVDGHPVRIFDCAGQVVYYGLLQLFLTPRAVYLLVWDAAKASEVDGLNLEDLAIAPWLRYSTFRVPDANVVLVGNKWDRVVRARRTVADDVERESRRWLKSWMEKAHGHQPHGLWLEDGVSLVTCAQSGVGVSAPAFGGGTGWPCDKSTPGLFHRIIYNDDKRTVTMHLPPSYRLALEMLEELASSGRRDAEQRTRGITRADLEEKWQAKVAELNVAGTPVAAPEAAMSGAILVRKWEGGLVEYGNYVFLDVEWFATVLDPLFSHRRDSYGDIDLGGIRVTNIASLRRLDKEDVFEPRLAEELWTPELAPHLLLALKSAGLTFPLPNDPNGGLVILLRMDTKPPPECSIRREEANQARKYNLTLTVACSFSLGLPPGFVERLLARCCQLGYPYPFWRYGALIVGNGAEKGLFSLSLGYSEHDNMLKVEVLGGDEEVHAWAALSKVLSVMIKMLSEFPGLPCEVMFSCPRHKTKGMPIRTTDAPAGSGLVEEGYFCPLCQDREAGVDLLAAALQVVKFSDEEFFDEPLRQKFAENAEKVARQGCASPQGRNSEGGVSGSASCDIIPSSQAPAPTRSSNQAPVQTGSSSQAPTQSSPTGQASGTPWYQDVKTLVGAASGACLTVFGVFAAKEDDDPRLWGVVLGVGVLLISAEFILIAREYKLLCFNPRVEAASAV
ncbi:unnamed protein product [Ectocarpus sp. 4 AP-2014]